MAEVARREWTRNPRYELEPFYFELGGCRRGRPVLKRPGSLSGWNEYGFDGRDRLVQLREYTDLPSCPFYEQFFTYRPGVIEAVRYSYSRDKAPICVERLYSVGARVSCHLRWAPAGQSVSVCDYENDQLSWLLTFNEEFGRRSFGGVWKPEYDGDGAVARIWGLNVNGTRRLAYERKKRPQGVA